MGYEEEELEEEEEVEQKPVTKKPGKKTSKKEERTEEYEVVKELPVQQVRSSFDKETGINTNFITIEEALTDIQNHFKDLTGGL